MHAVLCATHARNLGGQDGLELALVEVSPAPAALVASTTHVVALRATQIFAAVLDEHLDFVPAYLDDFVARRLALGVAGKPPSLATKVSLELSADLVPFQSTGNIGWNVK